MKEVTGNLWTYPADVRVITTNGFVKKNGEAVMGRGCALEAAKKWPEVTKLLGNLLKNPHLGNHVWFIMSLPSDGDLYQALYSFPVKHNWYEKADIALIERSANELVETINELKEHRQNTKTIVLPRPGCGNGQLKWEDVKPVLEPILDDRFHVITFA